MSLSFDGSAHQYVGTAAGTIGPAGVGDYTIVTLYQPSDDSTVVSLCSGSLSGTIEREIVNDNDGSGNKWYGAADFNGFGSWAANTWYLVGQSKAAGTNSYHWHTWPYAADGSGTKTHGDEPGTHGDGAAIAGIRIGDGDDKGRGSVALVAVWNRVLSDADFDVLCGNTAQAFMDLPSGAPNALLLCNVASPGDVVDVTGNGANATTVVGSGITIGADPPSFNYATSVPPWVNRTVLGGASIAQNGTISHTCTFTAAAAGNFLVAVMSGAVTFTTPTGWTLVNDAASSNGLYVFSKTASSGETSFTTSHGAGNSNYPILGVVYEFPAGTTVLASNEDQSMATTATTPTLAGLTGTYATFAARGWTMGLGTVTNASASWTSPTVKDYDAFVLRGGSPAQDGTAIAIAFDTNQTGSTFIPSSVYSFNGTGAGTGTNGTGVSWTLRLGVISTNNGAGMLVLVGL